ncbi:hypothetical protein B0H13DRAFT_544471 [Mycena leptocephala]|nr:hypothetical protein B0H13DRAFT_544471 [Mycena leptocephala]
MGHSSCAVALHNVFHASALGVSALLCLGKKYRGITMFESVGSSPCVESHIPSLSKRCVVGIAREAADSGHGGPPRRLTPLRFIYTLSPQLHISFTPGLEKSARYRVSIHQREPVSGQGRTFLLCMSLVFMLLSFRRFSDPAYVYHTPCGLVACPFRFCF